MFIPKLDLYKTWEDAEKATERPPYIAVFKKDEKTLIYIAEDHCANKSYDMTDFCYSGKDLPIPQIAVVEYERKGRKVSPGQIQENNLIYAAAVAAKRVIPAVYSDLSSDEMLEVLQKRHPEETLTQKDLYKALTAGGPSTKKGKYNFFSHELNLYGRDPFMIKNIVAALNKYDVVLAVFGEGHYRCHRLILEDMLGKPQYIQDVPNTRGNFTDCEIIPINLGVEPI